MHQHLTEDVHSVIMAGDVNIDVSDRDILRGCLKSVVDGRELILPTRFDDSADYMNPSLRYKRSRTLDGQSDDVELKEAFACIHRWGEEVGTYNRSTTYSAHRVAWIDMMWYSADSVRVHHLSGMHTPSSFVPNEIHGSDHMPLRAVFELVQ